MTTAYTSLLGLALPVQGELSGTWGDTVNNSITSLLDTSVAGTTNVSTDTDVTLTTTTGAANTARQAILLFSGARTALRTVTAPAQSKIYTVINATTGGFSVKLVGVGPTTGVTILAGESAVCAWNGSDFIKVSNSSGAGVFTSITNTGLTSGRVVYSTTGGLETDSANLTFNGTTLTAGGLTTTGTTSTGVLSVTGNTTLGDAAADNVTVNGTVTSNLIFTDNTYDIGASGATRPRNLFLAGNATIGGSIAATTLDLTNLEVTNIKAKDGTASITIADSTGAVSFANNVTLGDASTDTVTVNGYMGIGGAADSQYGLYVQSSALTGTNQRGIFAIPTATSAATSTISAIFAYPKTAAASFTVSTAASFRADDAVKGAGSTITNLHGLYIADQTQGTNNYGVTSAVSSGSNKFNIYASGTAQNYFAGNVGVKVSAPSESLSVACSSTTDNTFNPAIVVGPSGTGTQGGFIGSRTASANQLQGLYVRSNQTLTLWGDATGDGDLVLEVVSGASPSAATSANALLQLYATGSFVTLPAAGGAAVFNENGVDADFRVESDNNSYMLFVDAGNNKVALGGSTAGANDTLTVYQFGTFGSPGSNNAQITIDANANSGSGQASLRLLAGSGTTNRASRIDFLNGVVSTTAPRWTLLTEYNQDGTGDFNLVSQGSDRRMVFYSGSTVFNENGGDVDFRVESDSNSHMLFVDAGNNVVTVALSSPVTNAGALQIGAGGATDSSIGINHNDNATISAKYGLVFQADNQNTIGGRFHAFRVGGKGYSDGRLLASFLEAECVFNDDSRDQDFRVESDASTHMLFVDAGNNRVGINQSTPLASLDVGDSEIRQGGITTAVRTASNSTGAAIFLSQFGDVPITGWIHAVETGTSKYLILACYKESNAAAVTTTTLASNGLGVQATNSGGTVTLNGFTTGANVKMVAYVIGTTGAD